MARILVGPTAVWAEEVEEAKEVGRGVVSGRDCEVGVESNVSILHVTFLLPPSPSYPSLSCPGLFSPLLSCLSLFYPSLSGRPRLPLRHHPTGFAGVEQRDHGSGKLVEPARRKMRAWAGVKRATVWK